MSSATRADVHPARQALGGLPQPVPDGPGGPTDALSPRQQQLDWYWRFYRCTNYDGRRTAWDGTEDVGPLEREIMAASGALPASFYDPGSPTPLRFRRPDVPYYLVKVVVSRFTSLLFGQQRHPKITCDDPRTEDWLCGFAEATRLWAAMIKARNYGGAMGTAVVGFKVVGGRPCVEVHDPRWCTPEWEDRGALVLASVEKRYQFPETCRNADGAWEERWFWYRRVVDRERDAVWPKVPVGEREPDWERERRNEVIHGFGFCPVVWIHNEPVEDDDDGDPDCHGAYDLVEGIDALYSQAKRGTIANCDPTLAITSDAEFHDLRKGSGNGIQVEKGGHLSYLEMTGAGIDKAMALAERLEEKALTIVRCVLDRNEGGPSRTVAEVEHNYSSMIEAADVKREQYGEGLKRLLCMVLKVARRMEVPKVERDPQGVTRIVREVIRLPKRAFKDAAGGTHYLERSVGEGEQVELHWPDYFTPSADHVTKAVDAAGKAKTFGLIDAKHATQHVAPYFKVEDVNAVLENVKAEAPAGPPGGAGGGDLAAQVAQRTMSGAKSPLPDAGLSLMRRRELAG